MVSRNGGRCLHVGESQKNKARWVQPLRALEQSHHRQCGVPGGRDQYSFLGNCMLRTRL